MFKYQSLHRSQDRTLRDRQTDTAFYSLGFVLHIGAEPQNSFIGGPETPLRPEK